MVSWLYVRILCAWALLFVALAATCEGDQCSRVNVPSMLQRKHEATSEKSQINEDESHAFMHGKPTKVPGCNLANAAKSGGTIEIDLPDGRILKFKNEHGYKKEFDPNVFAGKSIDGNMTCDLVKKKKDNCVGAEIDCTELFGSITDLVSGQMYKIAPNADGQTEVVAINENDLTDEDKESEPVALPQGEVADTPSAHDLSLLSQKTTDTVIDMLVVWTKQAECAQSKQSKANCKLTAQTERNMRGMLDLAIEESNVAFEMSGVKADLRLVHAYRDPDGYDESAGFSDALNKITGTNDGVMDHVHAKREQYGADAVALVIDNPSYCGLGWMGPSKSRMFSVTKYSCATGYYSFVHELGHNMGLHHDRGTKSACSSSDYNFGYRDPSGSFRSIMAYGCKTGQCDQNQKNGCTRVQRFSNPNYKYNGKAIGDAGNDNARKLNEVREIVANYFPTGGTGGGSTPAPTRGSTPTKPPPSQRPTTPPTRSPTPTPRTTPTQPPPQTGGCADQAIRRRYPACSRLGGWCKWVPNARRRTWAGEVKEFCDKTCKRCSSGGGSTCVDKDTRRRTPKCALIKSWCRYIPNARRRLWAGAMIGNCCGTCGAR